MKTKKGSSWVARGGLAVALGLPLSVCAQDAYEPDNSASTAKTIVRWETQNHSIHVPTDVDWVKFTIPSSGAKNLVVVTAGDTLSDTEMWLYRGSGEQLAYNDDYNGQHYARIYYPGALSPGTYYVKIQQRGRTSWIPNYRVRASWESGTILADAYETDNNFAAAKPLVNWVEQRRTIHAAGDQDFVKLIVNGAAAVHVDLRLSMPATVTPSDMQMWLYKGDGTQLAYDYNSNNGYPGIQVAMLKGGTYYLKIQDYGNDGTVADYRLEGRWTPVDTIPTYSPDFFENDNLAGSAREISNGMYYPGSLQSRNIHVAGDTDWVKFTVGARGARTFRLKMQGDTQMWLYNGNGTSLGAAINSGPSSYLSQILLDSLPPGTYFIKIQENGNDWTCNNYTLGVDWIEPDAHEPNENSSSGRWISIPSSAEYTIHAPGDVDWFQFVVPGAGARNVEVLVTHGIGASQLFIYRGATGQQIGYSDAPGPNGRAYISFPSLSPGTYLIKVQEAGNNGTIPIYGLRAWWTSP